MKHNIVASLQVASAPYEEPRMSPEYFNAKYKDWLRRRGLTDPAYARELEQMEQKAKSMRFIPKKKSKSKK